MNQKVIAVVAVLALIVAGFGAYGWWARDLRWRPHVLTRHATEIAALLDQAGWLSPGPNGAKRLYLIDYRDDVAGARYQRDQVPRLQRAGVDTQTILFARHGDPQGAALVEKGQALVDRLTPLLADNGVTVAFPLLFWRDPKGHLRSCACDHRQSDRFVRRELGLR